ncbi:hypothetical protein SAMN05446037_100223 [Anaerovirgula multivorans]|uniref:Serine aminopeptidase S33 domain-containing protein n=1 Tax=Anaerovirgula multivorans TaxID=312168 RepID=A0A239AII1_9FIRM|nr:alpha/beta hydrolase [Anaerovirgula multivorans]SNR94743.1 hypothetical protein SAMN05446037_100223 [Anaerovirgula multivorans]
MYTFLIVFLVILVIILGISIYLSNLVIYPKTLTHEKTYQKELEAGRINKKVFEELYKEEVSIKSPFGYDLYGLYFPLENAKKTMILCHGITYTLYGSVKYMELYQKRGFNILLYDHRNHGKSGGHNTTYGFYEKYDLKAWSDWLFEKYGNDSVIGIHGESMGAAILLQNALIDSRIAFYVADCPYSSLSDIVGYRLKVEYHLPAFPFLIIASLLNEIRTGVAFHQVSPINDVDKIKAPVFFIHGKEDKYIPSSMTKAMYNAKKGAKELYLAPNAGHVGAYWNNQEEYDRLISEFLKAVHLN